MLFKTASLDSAIQELTLSYLPWCMSHYTPGISCSTNVVRRRLIFGGRFYFTLLLLFVNIFGGRFLKKIIPLAFVGYEMIIPNSYPTRADGVLSNVACEYSRCQRCRRFVVLSRTLMQMCCCSIFCGRDCG